jgi:dihydrofolate synthase/folylpolyglutamate synthase
MHRLTAALGMPQHRFASIHVVGTNGKSSVAQMTAAILEEHGLRTGTCLSPHLSRWSERVQIDGEEIGAEDFRAAVGRAAETAEVVNRSLDPGEQVTQFEVATAAAFLALAAARVDVAVVEAGLGGRLDATNVIPSRVTVLTTVGLDHTEWLGETETEIAAEKLAVLRDHSTLVLGRTSAEVDALAEETAGRRAARLVRPAAELDPAIALRAAGRFQRRNFALARSAAEAFLGDLDESRVRSVAGAIVIPGRLELIPGEPATIIDAAHNPDGAAALAEGLGELAGERPVIACIGILSEKDAPAMLRALAPALDELICTELPAETLRLSGRPDSRSWQAQELAAISRSIGLVAEAVPDPHDALAAARRRAEERRGIVLVAGSHYLLAAARAALTSRV